MTASTTDRVLVDADTWNAIAEALSGGKGLADPHAFALEALGDLHEALLLTWYASTAHADPDVVGNQVYAASLRAKAAGDVLRAIGRGRTKTNEPRRTT